MDNYLVIEVDDTYAKLLGQAVFSFGYYEWMIVYLIDSLENGFVEDFTRKKILTSGLLSDRLKSVINKLSYPHKGISKTQMEDCQGFFNSLIDKRNALIHGHPITDVDKSQILAYQTLFTKPIPDIKWTADNLISFINEINEGISSTSDIHDQLVHGMTR